MQRRRTKFLMTAVASLVTIAFFSGAAAWAATNANIPQVTLEVPIGSTVQVSGIAQYVAVFYRFAVSAVSIIAATMIMYAGISWLTAAGNTQRIGEAKERIIAAISGLILAMMSFVILNTINPELVELQNPTILISDVPASIATALSSSSGSSSSGSSAGSCPSASDWVNIYDTLNATNPNAAAIYQANHASTNLGKAKPDVVSHLLSAILAADALQMKIYVNGDSRTLATQQFLYDCYINSNALPTYNGGSSCVTGCSSCNLAAKPSCEGAPHLQGVALDVAWEPKTGTTPFMTLRGYAKSSCNGGKCVSGTTAVSMAQSQSALQSLMKNVGFKRICAEWWHFEYNGISTALCEPGSY